jgi:hypothetical protein
VAAFVAIEEDAIHWLAAADPRLATRAKAAAPEAILARIGTDAVIAEDATAQVRGGSLDLFAFKGRERALRRAAEQVAAFRGPLPDVGPVDGPLARPKLEHELLGRLIEEELTRAQDEAQLADAAGDLVRAVLKIGRTAMRGPINTFWRSASRFGSAFRAVARSISTSPSTRSSGCWPRSSSLARRRRSRRCGWPSTKTCAPFRRSLPASAYRVPFACTSA